MGPDPLRFATSCIGHSFPLNHKQRRKPARLTRAREMGNADKNTNCKQVVHGWPDLWRTGAAKRKNSGTDLTSLDFAGNGFYFNGVMLRLIR